LAYWAVVYLFAFTLIMLGLERLGIGGIGPPLLCDKEERNDMDTGSLAIQRHV